MSLYPISLYKYIFSATPWGTPATPRGSYYPPRGSPSTPNRTDEVRELPEGGIRLFVMYFGLVVKSQRVIDATNNGGKAICISIYRCSRRSTRYRQSVICDC